MKDKKERRKAVLQRAAIFAFVTLFFLGVILTYYTMLVSETRERIIKSGELSAVTTAEQIDQYLAKGIDTIKLACFTLDRMIRSEKSQAEIHDYDHSFPLRSKEQKEMNDLPLSQRFCIWYSVLEEAGTLQSTWR